MNNIANYIISKFIILQNKITKLEQHNEDLNNKMRIITNLEIIGLTKVLEENELLNGCKLINSCKLINVIMIEKNILIKKINNHKILINRNLIFSKEYLNKLTNILKEYNLEYKFLESRKDFRQKLIIIKK